MRRVIYVPDTTPVKVSTDWQVDGLTVLNDTARPVLIAAGSNLTPTLKQLDYQVAAGSKLSIPVNGKTFTFALGAVSPTVPANLLQLADRATVWLWTKDEPGVSVTGIAAPIPPNYYDRTPTMKVLSYSAAGVAPHAEAVRATYTVPAGKLAFGEAGIAVVMRDAASGAPALSYAVAQYSPAAGGAAYLVYAALVDGTVGAIDKASGQPALMQAGDTLDLRTGDLSTGGTVHYTITAKVVEFDAS